MSDITYVCHLYSSSRSLLVQTTVSGENLIEIRAACRTLLDARPGSTQAHLYLGAERMETIHAL